MTSPNTVVTPALFMDLLQSKKFKALLALVILWCKPVHDGIGLSVEALPWITGAFAAFFLSQGFRDLGEELVRAVKANREIKETKSTAINPLVPKA